MEPGQGNFPRKQLQRVDFSMTPERLNQIISGVKSQIEPIGAISNYSKLFMPDMSKRIQLVVNDSGPFYVYKINVPGFIYRQHVAGDWDAECGIRVLVSSRATFNTAYLYLDTKGSPVNANDHGNNLFPVRPGDNTYMIFTKYNREDNMNVYFVPAVGTVESSGEVATRLNPVSYPRTIYPGALTDANYLSCFSSSNDIDLIGRSRSYGTTLKFPCGTLASSAVSTSDESNRIITAFDNLLRTHPIKSGDITSVFPDMTNMVEMRDSIYRVNTAGYFYRHIKSAKSAAGSKSGIVLAPTMTNMEALGVGVYTAGPKCEAEYALYSGSPRITGSGYSAPSKVAVPAQAKLADIDSNSGRISYVVMTGNDRFGGSCINMIPITPGVGATGSDYGKVVVQSKENLTVGWMTQKGSGYECKVSSEPCVVEGNGTFVYYSHDYASPKDQYFFVPSKRIVSSGIKPITEIHTSPSKFTYGLKSKKINSVGIYLLNGSNPVRTTVVVDSSKTETRVVEFFEKCFTNTRLSQSTPFAAFLYSLLNPTSYPASGIPACNYESLSEIRIFNPAVDGAL